MVDPWKVEQCLWDIDLIFNAIEWTYQDTHRMATFQLTYATTNWWESEKATLGEETIGRMTLTIF